MALGDVSIISPGGSNLPSAWSFRVGSGTTEAIEAGEPVKLSGNNVVLMATGDPEVGTDVVVGIATSTSTETATTDGTVDVVVPTPGLVFSCKATTPGNMDTDAELEAILYDRVTFDLTSTTFTVDEDEGDDTAHGLRIVGGNIVTGDVYFIIRQSGTISD